MKKNIIFLVIMAVGIACKTSLPISVNKQTQHIQVQFKMYFDNTKSKFFPPVANYIFNVWHQDSIAISDVTELKTYTDEKTDTTFLNTFAYRFTDLRKKIIYEYESMSDTAKLTKRYDNADTLILGGGWNVLDPRNQMKLKNLQKLNDTIINGIKYLQHKYTGYFKEGKDMIGIGLSRCDKKGTIFQTNTTLSKAIGCPVVKEFRYRSNGNVLSVSQEIDFLSNSFPDSVKKAFAAWERNLQRFPVE